MGRAWLYVVNFDSLNWNLSGNPVRRYPSPCIVAAFKRLGLLWIPIVFDHGHVIDLVLLFNNENPEDSNLGCPNAWNGILRQHYGFDIINLHDSILSCPNAWTCVNATLCFCFGNDADRIRSWFSKWIMLVNELVYIMYIFGSWCLFYNSWDNCNVTSAYDQTLTGFDGWILCRGFYNGMCMDFY